MIEVEKKFIITKDQEAALIDGAEFLREKTFTDSYYDYPDWRWTTSDLWLRMRDSDWELKVPLNIPGEKRVSDQYHELTDEKEIAGALKLDISRPLAEVLAENNIKPFCSITTTRRKYKKDGFGIDIDTMDFGYDICEIELMVSDVSEIPIAEDKILAFSKQFNLPHIRVRGKVLEYLRLNNPAHMEAIETSLGTKH